MRLDHLLSKEQLARLGLPSACPELLADTTSSGVVRTQQTLKGGTLTSSPDAVGVSSVQVLSSEIARNLDTSFDEGVGTLLGPEGDGPLRFTSRSDRRVPAFALGPWHVRV